MSCAGLTWESRDLYDDNGDPTEEIGSDNEGETLGDGTVLKLLGRPQVQARVRNGNEHVDVRIDDEQKCDCVDPEEDDSGILPTCDTASGVCEQNVSVLGQTF